ncbi:MAG: CDP-diacylglycerol--glycerol-3-phosphate 3-phosphatidyltransferase [Clostridia bacterium]|nr:CDP-diacylglycerol--glycerol-3-phosphate 3-phosphatidyltransferase [Clostridia bacterium]
MNLPNKLSMIRICLIPVMVVLFSMGASPYKELAGVVFLLASITDYFDGQIARKRNLVTDFGRFVDPLADKLLVLSALILLSVAGQLPSWIVILILARDLAIDGLRMIVVKNGVVIAAGKLGKLKTASQMLYILLLIFTGFSAFSNIFTIIFTIWILVITIASCADYFKRYGKELIKEGL